MIEFKINFFSIIHPKSYLYLNKSNLQTIGSLKLFHWIEWLRIKKKVVENIYKPGNEEDLALSAIINRNKIKIKDSISTIIFRKSCSQIFIIFSRSTNFVNCHQSWFLINFVNDIPMILLPFHIHVWVLAFISHPHARSRL